MINEIYYNKDYRCKAKVLYELDLSRERYGQEFYLPHLKLIVQGDGVIKFRDGIDTTMHHLSVPRKSDDEMVLFVVSEGCKYLYVWNEPQPGKSIEIHELLM